MRKKWEVLNHYINNYLTYSKSEQRGIFVLLIILLILLIFRVLISYADLQNPSGFKFPESELEEFEKAWKRAEDSVAEEKKGELFLSKYPIQGSRDSLKMVNFIRKPELIIELNAADSLDLQQLKGIGPGFARRIVQYRERLGGFFHKRQLLEVFGMDSARYQLIADHIVVNPDSIHRMDIHTVLFKEMLRHPYFPFPLAKSIIQYRQKNKQLQSLEELRDAAGLSDTLFRRMVIYLRL